MNPLKEDLITRMQRILDRPEGNQMNAYAIADATLAELGGAPANPHIAYAARQRLVQIADHCADLRSWGYVDLLKAWNDEERRHERKLGVVRGGKEGAGHEAA